MNRPRKAIALVLSFAIAIGLVYALIPVLPSGSGFLPSFGGFFHVSEIQGGFNNVSYTVMFHEVNFTFLYWFWPLSFVDGNVTVFVAEQMVNIFVQVTFSDNFSQVLQLEIESPGSCLIGTNYYLHGITADHANPKAGIATAKTDELHSNWVYIVSFI